MGNHTPKDAVFAHSTDATDTKGDFEGGTTSIVASFDFHLLKTRELGQIPHVRPFWGPRSSRCGHLRGKLVSPCAYDAPGMPLGQIRAFRLSIENLTIGLPAPSGCQWSWGKSWGTN